MSVRVSGRLRRPELILAALVLALGAFFLYETTTIQVPLTATVVGPRFFPGAVGVLLVATALWLAVDVLRGGHGQPEGEEDVDVRLPTDWRTVGLVAATFAVHTLLVEPVGWPIAAAVLFFGIAFSLGARRHGRNAAISVVLAFGVYLIFAELLGVSLPAGVLEAVL